MIHGGIRFMQHAAFRRVRESLHHRKVFLNIAPHLVHPLPFIIPTYGHGLKGKEILTLGMIVYELLGIDKNITKDPSKKIPHFKVLSKQQISQLEHDINPKGLTGGILYYDCQMHSPERLTLAFIQSAFSNGADVFNYMKVNSLITEGNRIVGSKIIDLMSDKEYTVKSSYTINATGPWINETLKMLGSLENQKKIKFSKGIHLVTRSLTNKHAIALATKHQQAKSIVSRGGRHFFIAPWKNHSLLGTTNVDFNDDKDKQMVTKKDIEDFLNEIKEIYKPIANLTLDDIKYFYGGLYIDDSKINFNKGYQGNRNDQLFDHKTEDNLDGLISVIAVKYTTSLQLAERIVDTVVKRIGKGEKKSYLENFPVCGGDISDFDSFRDAAAKKYSYLCDHEVVEHLILNYGTQYDKVIELGINNNSLLQKIDMEYPYIQAEVIYALKQEMALKLTDIFLRRIGIGTLRKPKNIIIQSIGSIMAEHLKWNSEKLNSEIDELNSVYSIN
jgi:glycerol-3-phosphate dehydrogenase